MRAYLVDERGTRCPRARPCRDHRESFSFMRAAEAPGCLQLFWLAKGRKEGREWWNGPTGRSTGGVLNQRGEAGGRKRGRWRYRSRGRKISVMYAPRYARLFVPAGEMDVLPC